MRLCIGRGSEIMADVIRIRKRDVRKILTLYTIEGLSQKETGRAVFGREEIKGVSTYTVVQRVLHYFGLNMEHRRDYQQEGLTEAVIDRILDNRTIAFPLAVSTEGGMHAAVSFDAEVNKYLGGSSERWDRIGRLKNLLVVAVLSALTYFLVIDPDEKTSLMILILTFLGIIAFLAGIEGTEGRGLENDTRKDVLEAVFTFLYLIIMMGIGIYLS